MANFFHISDTADAMSRAAADFFVERAKTAISRNGRFTVSLSGGSTPEALFRLLAASPWKDGIDWQKVHIFWGDERCVPDDSPENNARMARQALLDHDLHQLQGSGIAHFPFFVEPLVDKTHRGGAMLP